MLILVCCYFITAISTANPHLTCQSLLLQYNLHNEWPGRVGCENPASVSATALFTKRLTQLACKQAKLKAEDNKNVVSCRLKVWDAHCSQPNGPTDSGREFQVCGPANKKAQVSQVTTPCAALLLTARGNLSVGWEITSTDRQATVQTYASVLYIFSDV